MSSDFVHNHNRVL